MDADQIKPPPSPRQIRRRALVLGVVIYFFCLFIYLLRPQLLEDIEGRLLDARFKYRGAVATSGLVSVVAVDEASLERHGRWPWSREKLAELIRRIDAAGAETIALDIVFSEPQPLLDDSLLALLEPGQQETLHQQLAGKSPDEQLAAAIFDAGKVINGRFFYLSPQPGEPAIASDPVDVLLARVEDFPAIDALGVRESIPPITAAAEGSGFFNFIPGRDGLIREAFLLMRYGEDLYPSLALRSLAHYLGGAQIVVRAEEFGISSVTLDDYPLPLNELGGFVLNYRGPPGTIDTISAADLLEGKLKDGALAGRLIILGVTAIGVYDAHSTPFGPSFPGLEIQANVVENLIAGDFIHNTAWEALTDLLVMALMVFACVLVLPRLPSSRPRFLFSLMLLTVYAAINFQLFSSDQLWLNLAYPLLAWTLSYSSTTLLLAVQVEHRYSTVHKAFQFYLQPDLVNQLTQRPDLLHFGGEQKRLTILFSDIRNFTNLSESMTPQQLAKFMQCYMDPMTEEVLNHRGTLDKYIGDAVMAIYGAPLPVEEHPRDACESALAMIAALEHIEPCCPDLHHIFPIRIGVGVHTGDVVVGNLGSSFHFTYTVLGDNVNLASRLEGLTKQYGVSILVSEATRSEVADEYEFRELDVVRVKGKQHPIRIFELRAHKGLESRPDFVNAWNEALAAFRARRWEEALERFENLELEEGGDAGCRLYAQRAAHYRDNPPPDDWDGVATFTTK